MISVLFRVLGGLSVLAGLAWSALALGSSSTAMPASAAQVGVAVMPGLGMIFCGLLLFAIGEALWQLGRIARHSATTRDNTRDILQALHQSKPPQLLKEAASNFGDAIQLFQAKTGKTDPGVAIKELATVGLRYEGYLR